MPEVSTKPPLPPAAPPRASILPLKLVLLSAQTTTLPPFPTSVALALMLAPELTTVWLAVGTPPWPCRSPPTSTVPPPAVPDASMAALPKRPTRLPKISTEPPTWPVPVPDTLIEPVITASPSPALRVTLPPFDTSDVASSIPLLFTTEAKMLFDAVLPTITISPPGAFTEPLLLTAAVNGLPSGPRMLSSALPEIVYVVNPSPLKSIVIESPEAITTLPSCATMVPLFCTAGATRKQKPLSAILISPWFTT